MREHNYHEKRDFIRMSIPAGTVVGLTVNEETIQGECKNLSGSGLLVVTREELQPGTVLQAEIKSTYGHKPGFKVMACVVRTCAVEGEMYETGLDIQEVLL